MRGRSIMRNFLNVIRILLEDERVGAHEPAAH